VVCAGIITFFGPLSIISVRERPARSQEPASRRPPGR
jgi:hypothetical protein